LVFWHHGIFQLNGTIAFTWGIMLLLIVGSALITRNLSTGITRSRWQTALELTVDAIDGQLVSVGLSSPTTYLPFVGTLYLFIGCSCLVTMIPGYEAPTASLSTTVALAVCVFFAVPLFGIRDQGIGGFLKSYLEPTPLMLPFNIVSELSRTLSLAIRLFGNMMSGAMIVSILVMITPFIFPIVMTLLGLLIGLVQAYIFGILASVYIAAAVRSQPRPAAATT
jgi:F-type H+-transporting ATPase subunit a